MADVAAAEIKRLLEEVRPILERLVELRRHIRSTAPILAQERPGVRPLLEIESQQMRRDLTAFEAVVEEQERRMVEVAQRYPGSNPEVLDDAVAELRRALAAAKPTPADMAVAEAIERDRQSAAYNWMAELERRAGGG